MVLNILKVNKSTTCYNSLIEHLEKIGWFKMTTLKIENDVLVITGEYSYLRKIPLKQLIACQIDGTSVNLHFLNEKKKWDLIFADKSQFNKIVPQLKQHSDFICANGCGNNKFYLNFETLTKVDVFLDRRPKQISNYEKLLTIQFVKNDSPNGFATEEKSDYKHKVFVELTFANKLYISFFPNSLQKALENHPTEKAKAVLDFLKSKNIENNVMHGLQS